MPENTNTDSSLAASDSAMKAPTAGGLLKAARQAAGVHLAVLSVNLKVPVRQLAALEADEYPTDNSPVFARGLAASVCRQLRVDPAPILALLPLSANYLEPHGAVRYAYTVPVNLGHLRRSSFRASGKAWWAAVGMLVVIAALIWLPSPSQWAWFDGLPDVVPVSGPVAEIGTSAVISMPVATPMTSTPELLFSAQNASWIEVRDGQKQLIWNGVLNAGETKRLPVAFPVSVVVGRADAIQLTIKGQAFDLKPHTLVNTARFEVKP